MIDLSRALADSEASRAGRADQAPLAADGHRGLPARLGGVPRGQPGVAEAATPSLGQLEPLLREVAEAGPVALYNVDENFFPLSVWLKGPMKTSIDELNRVADQLVSAEGELDQRDGRRRRDQEAGVRRPTVAGPAGAFLADGIIQTLGVDAYRDGALAGVRAPSSRRTTRRRTSRARR